MKNARPRFPAIRIAADGSYLASAGLLMLMLEGIVSISGGAGVQPFLLFFLPLSLSPFTVSYVRE